MNENLSSRRRREAWRAILSQPAAKPRRLTLPPDCPVTLTPRPVRAGCLPSLLCILSIAAIAWGIIIAAAWMITGWLMEPPVPMP